MTRPRRVFGHGTRIVGVAVTLFAACADSEKPVGGGCAGSSCASPDAGGDAGGTTGAAGGTDSGGTAGAAGSAAGSADGAPDVDGTLPDAPPIAPSAIFPWNGYSTGSALAPSTLASAPRRPRFRWTASPGASRYEVELDSSCDRTTFASCAFAAATMETATDTTLVVEELDVELTTPPLGTRYYWRVRACNDAGCSASTPVRYLDVGRMTNDFNGDGHGDLLVGAYAQDNPEVDEGEVYVYAGAGAGLSATPTATLHSQRSEDSGQFGIDLAGVGDFTGDGFSDAVVGADLQTAVVARGGRIHAFSGSTSGLPPDAATNTTYPSTDSDSRYGFSVAGIGDVNGDGLADVAVGARERDGAQVDEGQVHVYHGAASGLPATATATLNSPTGEAAGYFGHSLAGGADVNGDGFSDLAVGAILQDSGTGDQGGVFVYLGGGSGLAATPAQTLSNPENEVGGQFGAAVALADIDGDGYADLAATARNQDGSSLGSGKIWIFRGGPGGVSGAFSAAVAPPAPAVNAGFGITLASGDANADGFADLLVGAPDHTGSGGLGKSFLYRGSPTTIAAVPDAIIDNPNPADSAARFGKGLAFADTRGDGYEDLAIGAPHATYQIGDEGRAFVFSSDGAGASSMPSVTLENPSGQSGRFGWRLGGR